MARKSADPEEEELLRVDPTGETEDDLSAPEPEEVTQAVVAGSDWTAETILSQLTRGNIDLNPRFQRRDAWTDVRKSRFIESVIMGLPVPQLVLAERLDRRGTYLVIDGKQRLLALRRFAAEPEGEFKPLRLRGLEVRKDLNGKSLTDLRDGDLAEELAAFENQTIRTVVVRGWPNEDFLFRVFLRLNTGSVPLSPQELRQALHPGPFVDFADDYSSDSAAIQDALGLSAPDFRMRDVELLVRYFGFARFIEEYRGNLKAFLDMTCERLNSAWDEEEEEIRREAERCDAAIETTRKIFGEDAFRRYTDGAYEGRFNRAVFDAMVFYFRDAQVAKASVRSKKKVVAAFERLCQRSPRFMESITTTTKSIGATHRRLKSWGDALDRELNVEVSGPGLKDGWIRLS
jgi:hypothetical protein